jgi:hypothetical protein
LARHVAARLSAANPRGKREPLSTGPIHAESAWASEPLRMAARGSRSCAIG